MIYIHTESIGDAQEQVIKAIYEQGIRTVTEDKEICIDTFEPIYIRVENAGSEPKVSSCSSYGSRFISAYKDALIKVTPRKNDGTDATYTYGNRLRDYPTTECKYKVVGVRGKIRKYIDAFLSRYGYVHEDVEHKLVLMGDGYGGGIDQIRVSIIDRLIRSPNSRRAIALTWVPQLDIHSPEPPCLQIIWCRITDDLKLNLNSVFRSNDMLSASGMNLYALNEAQDFIISEINKVRECAGLKLLTKGYLENLSLSPHMYPKRDYTELIKFAQKLNLNISI